MITYLVFEGFVIISTIFIFFYSRLYIAQNLNQTKNNVWKKLARIMLWGTVPIAISVSVYFIFINGLKSEFLIFMTYDLLCLLIMRNLLNNSVRLSKSIKISYAEDDSIYLHFSDFPKAKEISYVLNIIINSGVYKVFYSSHLLSNERKRALCISIMNRNHWSMFGVKADTLSKYDRLMLKIHIILLSIKKRKLHKIYHGSNTIGFTYTERKSFE